LHFKFKMAKLSQADKMRIQTLREQGLGAKAIKAAYPLKPWKLTTLKAICRRVDQRGSAVERKAGSGRPKSARTAENIAKVEELICSQESQPGSSKSTRQIAIEVGISQKSVRNIAKSDLGLSSFKRVPVQVLTDATRLKRLARSKLLSRRITAEKAKRVFFTDEKMFYIDPPVNKQNSRVWAVGKKRDVNPQRLLVQRAKFSPSVMVSAGVCFGGKGRLHFVADKAKINADYYMTNLLPRLIENCNNVAPDEFIFQQDSAPAHAARQTQEWLQQNTPDFITKDEWPPNSPDLNPLDYHVWGAMLERYRVHKPKPKNKAELKAVLEAIWADLPQEPIDSAILAFRKRLRACATADGGHFEHLF
jgi:inhibitor of nuclear factor kappa-B kinase subunit alpha